MSYQWNPDFWGQWLDQAPVLCVDAVIYINGKVVLVKRATQPFQGLWHLPGGVVRKNETLLLALKRVVQHETGILNFQIKKQIGIFDAPDRDPRGHFITVAFLIETQDSLVEFNSQGEELAVFSELPSKLGFDSKKIIAAIKKN